MHGTKRVLKARMLAAGEDPPGRLELVNPAQSLQPGMIEQVLLGRDAVPVDALGDLDIAVQRIGYQVDRVVLTGKLTHGSRNILMTQHDPDGKGGDSRCPAHAAPPLCQRPE